MENPYQDVLQNTKKSASQPKKKQFFAHTDKNLKGISNLVQDDDLVMKDDQKRRKKKSSHNVSSNGEGMNNYYFYPQNFAKNEPRDLPEFGDLSAL